MDSNTFAEQLLPLLGGKDNIARQARKENCFLFTVKDSGAVRLNELRQCNGVASAELSRGRVRVTAQDNFVEDNTMDKNHEIAEKILANVGGKENISTALHCATRLRLTFKDETLVDMDAIKKVPGVMGAQKVGTQHQIIIGQNVYKVYEELCALAQIEQKAAVPENEEPAKKPLTIKSALGSVLDYLSSSMLTLVPVLMAAGLFRAVDVVLGPNLLNVLSEESDIYIFFNSLYNAGFYFLPLYVGYTAMKKLGGTPLLGMFLGGILLEPTFMSMASAEDPSFTVLGISATMYDYSSTIAPILLSVPVLYYLEKFLKKITPQTISAMVVPLVSVLVSSVISLTLLAPLGNYLANGVSDLLTAFYNTFGVLAVVLICAFGTLLTLTGMHVALGTISAVAILTTGFDPFFFVAGVLANFLCMGVALGITLRVKDKDEKATAMGFFISSSIGGVTEPVLYGLCIRYKRPYVALMIAGGIAGLYAGLTGVGAYNFPPASNFLAAIAFFGTTTSSIVNGCITCAIAFIAAAVLSYIFGTGAPSEQPVKLPFKKA